MQMPTARQVEKIKAAMKDDQRRLDAELAISEDLRNMDRVNRLTAHLSRVKEMLETGKGLPAQVA